ncbi:uncharacterized protein PHACADRAFT_28204 [Phanerochaete carnosa HHB-10118-sp]|uniref:TAFII55 protein conserved region domain-containing protein n=1 Tax=Phanerochaete carnosa (strain HHB-10118-sp) TaxID=650164 RepID=K5UYC8_PHACS|nr:uncharacterized protein PHACADRAFT_28204 [Phanerochaete carnosa HHB-10118-sp]EKM55141.1 hypothetical protein PHACADRAFT_28204 [Phanerochaete carnosa HHB-10118-sp]
MEDDDLIVVDDDVSQTPQTPLAGPSSRAAATASPATGIRSSLRQRRNTPPSYAAQMEDDELDTRRTRSSTYRGSVSGSKPQPKLRLKLSDKAAALAPGMSFLGPYDRELDSDDEDLAFEEQFVLRMPPGEDCDRLRKMVQNRDVEGDVWFKFKGAPDVLSQMDFEVSDWDV